MGRESLLKAVDATRLVIEADYQRFNRPIFRGNPQTDNLLRLVGIFIPLIKSVIYEFQRMDKTKPLAANIRADVDRAINVADRILNF